MRRDLPSGTVTFLFTDVEGSTRLIEELGEDGYVRALTEHRRILRSAFAVHRGVEVDTQGDAFLFAFADAGDAVAAAARGQGALGSGLVKVRMGLHTGEPRLMGEGYAGRELHRAARIAASGHGGQVVLSAATRAFVDGDLTDLGEHRLKDFEEPVPLFQLGSERFPPLKTISNTNLPRPASSFVGRERERDELVSMLQDGARLVTLSGPGGSGKTRLAIEAAAELVSAFKAGVFWVGLAALRDPELVSATIAQALGAKDGLAEHIGERELLLLLDNFEQVVEAAPELRRLLESCPSLKLMVTSRELLRIDGEVEYPVPPLAEREAVELFSERSRLDADETIAELCHRLDDLPLALELAAARTRVLTPAQILDRLGQRLDLLEGGRDADPRQQTLRATIEWSHDLLDGDERQLFAHLAVFRGGCTHDAAGSVCDADLDVLQSLVEKSLLRRAGDRFWMLQTIREFALERLEDLPEAGEVRGRHARWCLQLAGDAGLLDAELENLRTAIDWARAHDPRLEVELVEASWRPLAGRGLLAESLGYLVHALETANAVSLDQTELMGGAAYVAIRTGGYAAATEWSEQRLEIGRARNDDRVIASSLVGLALTANQVGDNERARTLYLEAADVAQNGGEAQILAVITYNLGETALIEGDTETARVHFRQTRELNLSLSDPGGEAFALIGLAFVALAERDTREATVLLGRSLRIARDFGARELIFAGLLGSAEVAAQRRATVRAGRLLAAAEALREEMGYRPSPLELEQRARVAAVVGDRDAGPAPSMDEAIAYALEESD